MRMVIRIAVGRRFPLAPRAVVALAFSGIAIWLLPPRTIAATLAAGWVFASGWFPRGSRGADAGAHLPSPHTS